MRVQFSSFTSSSRACESLRAISPHDSHSPSSHLLGSSGILLVSKGVLLSVRYVRTLNLHAYDFPGSRSSGFILVIIWCAECS